MPAGCQVSRFFAHHMCVLEGGPGHREEKAGEPRAPDQAGALAGGSSCLRSFPFEFLLSYLERHLPDGWQHLWGHQ